MESFKYDVAWDVAKTRDGESVPYEVIHGEGNMLVNGGASVLWERLIGTSLTAFNNANAFIGVGTSAAASTATMTDLQGTTHREAMDATYPVHVDGTDTAARSIVFLSTFETTDANFAWNEWGLFNAAAAGRMLNRKVASLGTKTSADSWAFTVTFSFPT